MLGAIAGDIIGSVYEFHPLKGHWNEFPLFSSRSRFTDDTVMTLAVASALQQAYGRDDLEDCLIDSMHHFGNSWPDAGYGARFAQWIRERSRAPYNSFGNGSAIRVSPAGWLAKSLEEAEDLARTSAIVTHNHPEGIKGAQAVAGAIWLARAGKGRNEIRDYASGRYGYELSPSLEKIRENYRFDVSCQGSVPEAMTAFLESGNFEEAVRKAIWLGGDADTQAAIAGSIAEAFYGEVPEHIASESLGRLDPELRKSHESWTEWLGAGKEA